MTDSRCDVAVVGGGILGLAHAWWAARRGLSVALFERHERPTGATVRNFGMVLVVGQRDAHVALARRSRSAWLTVAAEAGMFADPSGSLLPLRTDLEWAVGEEFAGQAGDRDVALIGPAAARRRMPALRADGLRGALVSGDELTVDPREVVARVPSLLAERYGVRLRYGAAVHEVADGTVVLADETWRAERVVVCAGDAVDALVPDLLVGLGAVTVTLQMLRTAPLPPGALGPCLLTGLTLTHYPAYAVAPSLPALRAELAAAHPGLVAAGVHVMATQHGTGELTLGDSHVYGDGPASADAAVDDGILAYLGTQLDLPGLRIASRWTGTYPVVADQPIVVRDIDARTRAVVVAAGIGMSLSFGIAEETLPA